MAFAGLLRCMSFQGEGSRGGGIAAIGGWQGGGGRGEGSPHPARTMGGGAVNLPGLHGGRLFTGKAGEVGGGWATVGDAPSGYGRGDGSPHPRGQRGEGRLIFPVFTGAGSAREKRVSGRMGDRGGRSFEVRKRGWVPASARTTGGGTVNLPRLYGGRFSAGKTGVGVRGTGDHEGRPYGGRKRGMGPRIREDNGGWDG